MNCPMNLTWIVFPFLECTVTPSLPYPWRNPTKVGRGGRLSGLGAMMCWNVFGRSTTKLRMSPSPHGLVRPSFFAPIHSFACHTNPLAAQGPGRRGPILLHIPFADGVPSLSFFSVGNNLWCRVNVLAWTWVCGQVCKLMVRGAKYRL